MYRHECLGSNECLAELNSSTLVRMFDGPPLRHWSTGSAQSTYSYVFAHASLVHAKARGFLWLSHTSSLYLESTLGRAQLSRAWIRAHNHRFWHGVRRFRRGTRFLLPSYCWFVNPSLWSLGAWVGTIRAWAMWRVWLAAASRCM